MQTLCYNCQKLSMSFSSPSGVMLYKYLSTPSPNSFIFISVIMKINTKIDGMTFLMKQAWQYYSA